MTAAPASPAPAASVAPAAPITPAPSTPPPSQLADSFADLEGMADIEDAIAQPPPGNPPAAPKKPDAPKPPEKPAEPVKKPDEPVKPDAPAPDPETPKVPAQLRKAYEDLKRKHAELQQEHEKAKTAKPEPDPEIMTRLQKEENRRQALEDEMKFVAYERSQEFAEKYHGPFVEAYNDGRTRMESLDIMPKVIMVEDPATGDKVEKVIRQGRAATAQDFDSLMAIPNDRDARKFAKDMFGEDAALALQHREKVIQLNTVQTKALEDFKKTGAEREKQQLEARAKVQKQTEESWQTLNKAAAEKYPQYFKPAGPDAEGNPIDAKGDELLQKGYDLVDRAFSPDAAKMPPEELVKLHSSIRNRAAAFGRLTYQNKQLSTKVAELEKSLLEYRGAEPPSPDGDPTKKGEQKWGEDALESYAQRA